MSIEKPFKMAASVFGLIAECQFDRRELYGFEVELNGRVVTPEFNPKPIPSGELPALMTFTSEVIASIEDSVPPE